jgi:hypothetical protein
VNSEGFLARGACACRPLRTGIDPRSTNSPLQLAFMTEYVARRGWSVVVQIEDVRSGVSVRPRREELLCAARRREVDLVLWSGGWTAGDGH